MFSDLLKIILQQKMDFVTSEAWARHLKTFSEGQKIPRTSLGEKRLMCFETLCSAKWAKWATVKFVVLQTALTPR